MNENLLKEEWVKENKDEAQKFVQESSFKDFFEVVVCVWQTTEDLTKLWLETPILIDGNNYIDPTWVLAQKKEDIQKVLSEADDATIYKVIAAWNSIGGTESNSHALVDLWSQIPDFVNKITDLTSQVMEEEEKEKEE